MDLRELVSLVQLPRRLIDGFQGAGLAHHYLVVGHIDLFHHIENKKERCYTTIDVGVWGDLNGYMLLESHCAFQNIYASK